jgi:hypothetical protein
MKNESTNEAKHTPRPWPLRDIGHGIRIGDIAWIGFGSAHHKEEHRANARLIAAAPDLLEALIDALGWLECAIDCEADLSGIEAAIAKATGRATP